MKIEKPGTSVQYFPNERDFFGESNLQFIWVSFETTKTNLMYHN